MPEPRILATVRSYRELHAVLRSRSEERHITRLESDDRAGLSRGYSSTLLAPAPVKKLGIVSLGAMLSMLNLKLLVVEDENQTPV